VVRALFYEDFIAELTRGARLALDTHRRQLQRHRTSRCVQ
jgi:hypothetical protein